VAEGNHLPENGPAPEIIIADPAALATGRNCASPKASTRSPRRTRLYGIGLVTSLLARGLLLISDRCWGVIKEMPDYHWDPKKAETRRGRAVKVGDDSLDMLRYVVTTTEGEWRDEVGPRPNSF
jgi:hypothetical protein